MTKKPYRDVQRKARQGWTTLPTTMAGMNNVVATYASPPNPRPQPTPPAPLPRGVIDEMEAFIAGVPVDVSHRELKRETRTPIRVIRVTKTATVSTDHIVRDGYRWEIITKQQTVCDRKYWSNAFGDFSDVPVEFLAPYKVELKQERVDREEIGSDGRPYKPKAQGNINPPADSSGEIDGFAEWFGGAWGSP